ncbi:SAM-dependent methyltransferase [Thermosipho sp. 1063]|uniref:class I SAM-dependent rRNA methyltransferase n=1 Tax=unclassified Thermosipho (in: thermotogales) TaxID=2676525 RepID=UPI000949265E|nr:MULTISPECIES: class I SAM-dependent rRNA methyltransferase [unclassified Thermosipho (in: thermotogales)]ANQ53113.1 SAM-dependent methyltransferase [Thermosipho sp. 1070]APT71562.1 SAM-dependent methyltransferase [Thermosipho sp. 1063]OOC45638.1 SAM-dependent methyltransferase [Thermosipho sp. 1074]
MKVFLKKDIKNRIKNGHPWIYENEIERIEGIPENGGIVNVFNHEKSFLGKGYINFNSKIRVRILTRKAETIGKNFIKKRFLEALERRHTKEKSFRVIFSEADNLSGLIVDKFQDYIVLEINTLGIEKLKNHILDVIIELFNPKGIFEKSDSNSREKEGLKKYSGWIYKSGPELIPFELNDLKFFADTQGQKTGAFLDQRLNVKSLERYSKDKVCLDAFCYTGNFGMHMLLYGAKYVTFLDYSQRAIDIVNLIAKENGFKNYETIVGNAFDILKQFDKTSKYFDVVSIDPPSFAKKGSNKKSALKGYKEINLRAMRILKNHGILATSSCTQIISEEEFDNIIFSAGIDTSSITRVMHRGAQPYDHPYVLNILETKYLKFRLLEIEKIKE